MGVGGALPLARPMAPTAAPGAPAGPAAGGLPAGYQVPPPPKEVPKDYQLKYLPEQNRWELEVIPGSATAEAKKAADVQRLQTADNMLQQIDRVAGMSSKWTTGIAASPWLALPNTPAHDMATKVESINGQALVSMINQMRASNPTGGAMGQMSTKESEMMVNAATALRQTNSKGAFDEALADLRKKYVDMAYGTPEQLATFLHEGKINRQAYDTLTEARRQASAARQGVEQPSASTGEVIQNGWRYDAKTHKPIGPVQ